MNGAERMEMGMEGGKEERDDRGRTKTRARGEVVILGRLA